MKIAVVAPKVPKEVKNLIGDRIVYACDSAVEALHQAGIRIDLAIGDFDSIKDKTCLNDLKTIKLAKEKDDSDTHYALRHAYQQTDDVILVGGIEGKRVDHLIANLLLLERYNDLVIYDDYNIIRRLEVGDYTIKKGDYAYVSIFPLIDTNITLLGAKYPLVEANLYQYDTLGLSNEIKYGVLELKIHKGIILCIQSKR